MSGFRIHFDETGAEPTSMMLMGIGDRATDAQPVFRDIADDLRRMELKLFATEDHWPPLKESTLEKKARGGFPLDILKETEALYDSLTKGKGNASEAGGFALTTDLSLHFGTSIHYAIFHKLGTRFMPKRDPLQVTVADRRRWQKMIQRHLMNEERAMFGVPQGPFLG